MEEIMREIDSARADFLQNYKNSKGNANELYWKGCYESTEKYLLNELRKKDVQIDNMAENGIKLQDKVRLLSKEIDELYSRIYHLEGEIINKIDISKDKKLNAFEIIIPPIEYQNIAIAINAYKIAYQGKKLNE